MFSKTFITLSRNNKKYLTRKLVTHCTFFFFHITMNLSALYCPFDDNKCSWKYFFYSFKIIGKVIASLVEDGLNSLYCLVRSVFHFFLDPIKKINKVSQSYHIMFRRSLNTSSVRNERLLGMNHSVSFYDTR